jgi:primosomal replication protein N
MLLTIEGTYVDGKVELSEAPAGVKHAKVLVTFLSQKEEEPLHHYMTHGQFPGKQMSTEEDFQLAEWREEPEDRDDD